LFCGLIVKDPGYVIRAPSALSATRPTFIHGTTRIVKPLMALFLLSNIPIATLAGSALLDF